MTPNNLLMRRRMMMACGGWNGYVYRNGVWAKGLEVVNDTKGIFNQNGDQLSIGVGHWINLRLPMVYEPTAHYHIGFTVTYSGQSGHGNWHMDCFLTDESLTDKYMVNPKLVKTNADVASALQEAGEAVTFEAETTSDLWVFKMNNELLRGKSIYFTFGSTYGGYRVSELIFEKVKSPAPAGYKDWQWGWVHSLRGNAPYKNEAWCITPPQPVTAGHKIKVYSPEPMPSGSALIFAYKENTTYYDFWYGTNGTATINSVPAAVVDIRCTFPIARLDECYIYDETDDVHIWKGAAVN